MIIYQGSTDEFCNHVRLNQLTDIMNANFFDYHGRFAGISEFNSWQNSLSRVRDVIELACLSDNMITLEYEIPYNNSRIDCLLFGKDINGCSNIVLIELKQWDSVKALPVEGNFVETYTGGGIRTVSHPAQQVKGYESYLMDFVEEFQNPPPLNLFSCSYCHNYSNEDDSGLFDPIYKELVQEYPVYCKEDTKKIAIKIKELLESGKGFEILNRFMQSRIRPSKKILDNIKEVIQNDVRYSLINEQLVAKNTIWSKIRRLQKKEVKKSVIIIKGGPGTGKSVIALNVLAELAQRNTHVLYACKSKTFREGLQSLVGTTARNLFTNLYTFVPARVKENELDVLLVDEAHRIEKTSNFRYTKKEHRTNMPQIDQLIRCAKISVFFIDDYQSVRAGEIGNSSIIKETASALGLHTDVVELHSQFRCMGSNNYIEWIESVLGYSTEKKIFQDNEVFDFKIFNSPSELYESLKEKEKQKPNSARLTAGYCWEWSDPLPNGALVHDVIINDFTMPWETKGLHAVGDYPPWYKWAFKPKGFEQVGCIYTIQGFEFDYVGVIIGNDLYYDDNTNSLKCDVTKTCDPTLKRDKGNFEKYVKNIYRVLLSRGMKGCYVYFINKNTEKFFRSRIENN